MTITFSQLGKQGRAGNQIWQAACVVATAKRTNQSYEFPPWEYEPYFNLHNCFNSKIKVNKVYQEKQFHYVPIPKIFNVDLSGYFQSWKYFDDYKDLILKLFTPIYHVEKEPGLCSIHIRRGDYLNFQNCHPILSLDYYNKAMEISKCNKFLVFSDDITWAKNNFTGNMFEFSEDNNPAIDLALMAKKCESNIIANSSFSWWAGYINRSPTKVVIAPKIWFGPGLPNHDTKDLLPSNWIKI